MFDRIYYCYCDDNCKFETMTKEQILTAIYEAVTNGEIKDIDAGFITTVKEQNKGNGLAFWLGTTAEYNAITEKDPNCFYIKTDDTTLADLDAKITAIEKIIESINDVEDITADFFESKEGFSWVGNVYKQGKIISGSFMGSGVAGNTVTLFKIKRQYTSAAAPANIFTGLVGTSDNKTAAIIAGIQGTAADVLIGSDLDGVIFISFTYMCN